MTEPASPTRPVASQQSATSWAEVVRLRTLPAAVAPVILGGGAAVALGTFSLPRTLLAAGVALALQIGSNLANDYSDGVRGTDDERTGPPRLTASGLVAPSSVKRAAFGCFGVAALLGLVVVVLTQQWWLVLAGVAAVAAAWFYTGGPRPYGYAGLGEVFVFVFFGLMATCGTVYIQGGSVPGWVWVAACGIGLIACSLLMVNNLRDIDTDPAHGKRTLAVRLGDERARTAFVAMVYLPVALGLGALAWAWTGQAGGGSERNTLWAVVVLLVVLLVLSGMADRVTRPVVARATGRDLIPVLRDAGFYELVYGVLIALGLIGAF
ncbi:MULTISPECIES: 1,4-dihydroxy-2-naphthoate polyprenyltransferase [unclassified Actinomyces]|uniref:1,4-dihydroxy-2-naphthoate polyprenyltransferase n=1 Tax=unclassified Actinomyces TaxID=2609248 RepID=UPI002017BD8E|nr:MULTISPECIES: 1,4-dihydroxy-2-naphthoate polyprenyltransferase [unclassified Actinomyces]MCL3776910.1 1,4-dihydroxy-2-naphthoate polyprenyltransferase [Actinomyces sp. AC-20-1]MCL3790311.1 1,4-dihydroxy-2-naphthoate polyprenyltransferase [Actinomyces sp. 187325]MCL3792609.1 1,4-dihydroxy-2-naphthoate polyprenyltransferase [Actinomyces sp. 186855]MCL3794218.1 1,4-dihydroxy-2-naphthoate polyprenyltransferase [Actinomyces sp. 217892]